MRITTVCCLLVICGISVPSAGAKVSAVCTYNGETYRNKQTFPEGKCKRCTCSKGRISCKAKNCDEEPCDSVRCKIPECEDVVEQEDLCCPFCRAEPVEKTCKYNGNKYKNGDLFRSTDGCNSCRCGNGKVSCTDNECNRGECSYNGQTYRNGQNFKESKCRACKCTDGEITCKTSRKSSCKGDICKPRLVKCVRPECEDFVVREDLCCPLCTSGPPIGTCDYNGVIFDEGEVFMSQDGCNKCGCRGGIVACTKRGCRGCKVRDFMYRSGESFLLPDGCNSCLCRNGDLQCTENRCKPCEENGREIPSGSIFPAEEGCGMCTCSNGRVRCESRSCPFCIYNEQRFPHGEMFPREDGCNQCQCNHGEVTCTELYCGLDCMYDGIDYKDRQPIPGPDGSNTCWCNDGFIECIDLNCTVGNSSCLLNGTMFDSGTTILDKTNRQCMCTNGNVECTEIVCGEEEGVGKLRAGETYLLPTVDGDKQCTCQEERLECETPDIACLKHLLELHIHLRPGFILEQEVFNGLNALKLLDLSGCLRMNITRLVPSLKGHDHLPRLESLNLSSLSTNRDPVSIKNDFAQALGNKNISSIDISFIRIREINATALATFIKTLKRVNVSFSSITKVILDINATVNKFDQLDVLDLSHTSDLCRIGIPSKIVNQSWDTSQLKESKWYSIIAPKVVNISACVQYPASIWIGNSTLSINSFIKGTSEEIIGRQNNLKHLDLKVNCNNYSFGTVKHINIAENGLDFIHPSLLSCVPNLRILDLSGNNLYKMQSTHTIQFQQLLTSVQHLKVIKFASNFLKSMPHEIFINNKELDDIDLSNNELDQVTFALNHLENLKVLDLRDNKIKILTQISMRNIDSINTNLQKIRGDRTTVHLENNPLSCSKCDTKDFMEWLTSTKSANLLTPNVTCFGEKGKTKVVNEQVLQLVQDMCKKRMIIIITAVAGTVSLLLVILLVAMIYKYRKRVMKKANKRALLHNIQDDFEFVIFLSYSSDDKAFVDEYLVQQLKENMQLMTGIDRNLVCTGDDFLRPGFRILDEITNCIDRASAFVVVLSDSFCESMYCHHEVDMAFRLNKPIVLMIKGHVDEDLMKPLMKTLFKSTVRVLWTMQNDKYVMSTTWENVCNSVLDLMADNIK